MMTTSDEKILEKKNTYFVRGPVRRWNSQKKQSESNEYVRGTTGIFTNSWRINMASESYFHEHAPEVWERTWMNPDVQTTLLNTYQPQLITTFSGGSSWQHQFNAFREFAGQFQKSVWEDSGMMSTQDICQKMSCWLPDVKRLGGYILKVSAKVFQCTSAQMQARSGWT